MNISTAMIETRVRKCVAQALNKPSASLQPDDLEFESSEWDSLGQMELISSLEAEFGITLKLSDIVKITDLPTAVSTVARVLDE